MTSKLKTQTDQTQAAPSPLEQMLRRPASTGKATESQGLLFLGELVTSAPRIEVEFQQDGQLCRCEAASLVALGESDIGKTVVLSALAEGQGQVVLGLLHRADSPTTKSTTLRVNNKRIEIAAEEELVLRCGEASICIDQSGAITVKGKALLSRAEGTNRVQGGAVQIN